MTRGARWITSLGALACAVIVLPAVVTLAQQQSGQAGRQGGPPPPPPTLGLDQGLLEFDTPEFTL